MQIGPHMCRSIQHGQAMKRVDMMTVHVYMMTVHDDVYMMTVHVATTRHCSISHWLAG